MKISKILAGISAMAVAATMAISASAATTINIAEPNTTQWEEPFPKYDPGDGKLTSDYIDGKSLTKGTALDVTVNFEWAEDGVAQEYCGFKACYANGWAAISKDGYITNANAQDEGCEAVADGVGYTMNGQTVDYMMQSDGFFVTNVTTCNQIKFTITAEGVDKMYDNASASEEAYDGLQLQINGVKVTSIELSQDGVKLSSEMKGASTDTSTTTDSKTSTDSKTTTDSKSGSTGTSSKSGSTGTASKSGSTGTTSGTSDSTADTGVTAGLALAGIALAGAAFVVSKKK